MNTHLAFTRNSALRTVLVNEGTHQPLYKIDTSRTFWRKTTKIYKISPSICCQPADDSPPDPEEEPSSPLPVKGAKVEESYPPTESAEIARIHWHFFSPPRVVYNGRIMPKHQLLPKAGTGYTFTARGMKLWWKLGWWGTSAPQLVVDDDDSMDMIAQFHLKSKIVNKQKAYLEITPSGMEILDDIVLTLIFAEKKRQDREKRERWQLGWYYYQ